MRLTQLRSKEVNKLIKAYGISLNKKDSVQLQEDEHKLILVNKKPQFFYYKGKIVPTLQLLQQKLVLKKIIIDSGAIKFVINGADVMRPGITEIEDGIENGDFIVIIDQNNGKALSVGIALLDAAEMRTATNGKIIKNIHFIGDGIWKK